MALAGVLPSNGKSEKKNGENMLIDKKWKAAGYTPLEAARLIDEGYADPPPQIESAKKIVAKVQGESPHTPTVEELINKPEAVEPEVEKVVEPGPMVKELTRELAQEPEFAGSREAVLFRTALHVAGTEFVSDAFRGKPAAVFGAFLLAEELGIGKMGALQHLSPIRGRLCLSAQLCRQLIYAAGGRIDYEVRSSECVRITGTRPDGSSLTVEWTLQRAASIEDTGWSGGQRKITRLIDKSSWKNYPTAMLDARATTELARALFPDALGGLSYTVEEIGEE